MTTDVYASKYVPLGYRTANPDETDARRIAQDLKNADEEAIQITSPTAQRTTISEPGASSSGRAESRMSLTTLLRCSP
jgi:hypothetical protein